VLATIPAACRCKVWWLTHLTGLDSSGFKNISVGSACKALAELIAYPVFWILSQGCSASSELGMQWVDIARWSWGE